MKHRLLVSLCVLLSTMWTNVLRANGPRQVKVGERYFDFVLPDIATGAPTTLSQFRGRKVLLIEFASW